MTKCRIGKGNDEWCVEHNRLLGECNAYWEGIRIGINIKTLTSSSTRIIREED